jgi:hypothetical protein
MVARKRRSEYVLVWKKKRAFFNPSGSYDFFVVKACTQMRVRVQQLNHFEFERRLAPDQSATGISNLDSSKQKTDFWTYFGRFHFEVRC